MSKERLDERVSERNLQNLIRLVGKQLQRNPKIMEQILKVQIRKETADALATETFLDDVMAAMDEALESVEDNDPILERMTQLAGLLSESPTSKSLKRVILVTDATPESELADVMHETDIRGLVKLFLGAGRTILIDNPTLYDVRNERDALKDATERMERER